MKINCIIIDDEPVARKGIENYVSQIDFLNLKGSFENAIKANEFLQTDNSIQLVFSDIQMPSLTGIDFLKSLSTPPAFIFTTAYPNHALEGYELDVIDYLLKPIAFDRFLKAANKALNQLNKETASTEKETDHIFIKSDKKFVKIFFKDILYIEGLKDYVLIHTTSKREIALVNLKNLDEQLPNSKFLRVHKSYIVSIEKVQSIMGNLLYINDHKVPVGKSYKDEVSSIILGNNLVRR